jgi:hypothetical protein
VSSAQVDGVHNWGEQAASEFTYQEPAGTKLSTSGLGINLLQFKLERLDKLSRLHLSCGLGVATQKSAGINNRLPMNTEQFPKIRGRSKNQIVAPDFLCLPRPTATVPSASAMIHASAAAMAR